MTTATGETPSASVIWFDFETALSRPGERIPQPAILTTYDPRPDAGATGGARLWLTRELAQVLEALLDTVLASPKPAYFSPDGRVYREAEPGCLYLGGHNIATFDCPVIAQWFPWLRAKLWQAFEEGRFIDTMIAERIIQIQRGMPGELGQTALGRKYGVPMADKDDPAVQAIRMSFGQFIGAEEIPYEHAAYALGDPTALPSIFDRQMQTGLVDLWDVAELGRQQFCLALVSARGFRTDIDHVRKLEAMVAERIAMLEDIARECGFLRKNAKGEWAQHKVKIQEAIGRDYAPDVWDSLTEWRAEARKAWLAHRGAVKRALPKEWEAKAEKWYAEEMKRVWDTDPPDPWSDPRIPKTEKGNVCTDRLTLTDAGDLRLQALSEWGQLRSIKSKDLPIFQRGSVEPIHTRFTVLDTTRSGSSDPNCFDGETEVLTPDGWTRFDRLRDGAPVAQWRDGRIEFVQPTEVIRRAHVGEMLRIRTERHTDLLVTPDHRCPLIHRRTGELRVYAAQGYPEDWKQLHAGQHHDGDLALPAAFITMLCATQADGSYVKDGGIRFGFSKARKADRLRAALLELGWHFTEGRGVGGGHETVTFYIGVGATNDVLRAWLPEKRFDRWVLRLEFATLCSFCDEVWLWDGCATRMNHYASQHRSNADWVQTACALRGWRARIRRYDGSVLPSWQVDVVRKPESMTTNRTVEAVSWHGPVYCVTVPSSYVLVRRGAVVMVSGNCQNFGKLAGVRECIKARDGYAIASSDYKMLELVALGQLIYERLGLTTMVGKLNGGIDMHAELGADLLGCTYEEIQRRRKAGDHDAEEARDAGKPYNFGANGGMRNPETFMLYARKSYGQDLVKRLPGESVPDWNARRLVKARQIMSAGEARNVDQQAWIAAVRRTKNEIGLFDMPLPRFRNLWRHNLRLTEAANNPFQILGMRIAIRGLWLVIKAQYCTGEMAGSHVVLFVHDDVSSETPLHLIAEHVRVQERLMCQASREVAPDVFTGVDSKVLSHLSKGAKATRSSEGGFAVTEVSMPARIGKKLEA